MPLPGDVRYRTVQSGKGPVRLAFRGGSGDSGGTVVEAKNLTSGATHTADEFKADRKRAAGSKRQAFKDQVKGGLMSRGTGKHDGR